MESDIYSYLSVYLDLPDEKGAEKEKKTKADNFPSEENRSGPTADNNNFFNF